MRAQEKAWLIFMAKRKHGLIDNNFRCLENRQHFQITDIERQRMRRPTGIELGQDFVQCHVADAFSDVLSFPRRSYQSGRTEP